MMKSSDNARAHVRRLFSEGKSWTLRQLTDDGRYREDTIKQYLTDLKNPTYSGGPVLKIYREGDTYYLDDTEHAPARKVSAEPSIQMSVEEPIPAAADYSRIWAQLLARLDAWDANWRGRVSETAVTAQRLRRVDGEVFSDTEVMEAACLSIFSAQIDWKRIQDIKEDLLIVFENYEPALLAAWSDSKLEEVRRWFLSKRAGSQNLKRNLHYIREAARKFDLSRKSNLNLDTNLALRFEGLGKDPIALAVSIATPGKTKIPGMGVPLAAEFLRNLGYDLAKPDIHILRAAGCFNMVQFKRWADRSSRRSPSASVSERMLVMQAMGQFAKVVGVSTTYLDSVVWTACAKSGAWLMNSELKGFI